MSTGKPPTIPDFVRARQSELAELCREFGVVRLELFGSATSDAFNPETSDLDFIVEFDPNFDLGPWMGKLYSLEDRLKALFGRKIDTMFAGEIRNPYLRENVNETRIEIYAA
ncbi:MAG TPA: nucleotidyltransferase domain-containing protein [Thermomicrobiales bacterium]|nr:nucleotidyltransferase domain-containing protein [Thermomicrobiales bacterium]HRA47633.1 nucleotidyltransferase domain-containing protein [Thermomicrobiales bacterium]